MQGEERLSSSSLTVWPFDQASNVPAEVCRLFSDCSVHVPDGAAWTPSPSISGVSCSGGSIGFHARLGDGMEEDVSVSPESSDGYTVATAFGGLASIVVDNAHVLSSGPVSGDGPYALDASCVDFGIPSVRSFSLWNPSDDEYRVVDRNGDVRDGYLDLQAVGGLRRGRRVLAHGGPVGIPDGLFWRCPQSDIEAMGREECLAQSRAVNRSAWHGVKGLPMESVTGISGDVGFMAGRNIRISRNADGSIVVSAVPGAGEGRVPCECDDVAEDSNGAGSGGLHPDEFGGVSIVADGCYQVTAMPGTASIRIDGRCSACCPVEKCAGMAETERAEADETFKAFVQLMHERYYVKRGVEKINYGLEWNVSSEMDWECGGSSGSGREVPAATCVRWDPLSESCSEFRDLVNPNLVVKMAVTKTFERFDFSDTDIVGRFERVSVTGYLANRMRKSTATMSLRGFSACGIAMSDGSFEKTDDYDTDVVQSFTVKTPSGDVIVGSDGSSGGRVSLPDFVLPPRSVAEFTVVFRKRTPSGMSSRSMCSPRGSGVPSRSESGVLVWVDFHAAWANMLTEEDAERFDNGDRAGIECAYRSPISAYVDNFRKVDGGSTDEKEDDRYVVVDGDFDDEDPGELVRRDDEAYVTLAAVLKERVSPGGDSVSYRVYYDRLLEPESLFHGCYVPESFTSFWEGSDGQA